MSFCLWVWPVFFKRFLAQQHGGLQHVTQLVDKQHASMQKQVHKVGNKPKSFIFNSDVATSFNRSCQNENAFSF
jgi:uncharacterized Ntn-hydrolase superfamily protein